VEATVPALVGRWDGARLERVLLNLLANAVKYSPGGGEISLTVSQEDHWATVVVRDQGLGIPTADLPHIFERFHRAGNVGRITGTGIGLAEARQIVEQHGGTITVASQEGSGTTFALQLPLR
jgi:signal transduction histidine kinase